MKKWIACLLIAAFVFGGMTSLAADKSRGGFMGFIAGCCFGIRAGQAYNDGKEIHWREWVRVVPVVNIVCAIWDGADGYSGKTSADFAKEYGSLFY